MILDDLEAAIVDARHEVELSAWLEERASIRIADGSITEAAAATTTRVRVRVAIGDRVGSVLVGSSDRVTLRDAIEAAAARARPRLFFDGFGDDRVRSTSSSTHDCIALAESVVRDATDLHLSGSIETIAETRAVVTTRGGRALGTSSSVSQALQAYARDPGRTARRTSCDDRSLLDELRRELSLDDTLIELEPGPIDVLLGPAAVAELVEWLALIGLGARSVLDGDSFLPSLPGVTLTDDPAALGAIAFDAEGTPTPALRFEGLRCTHDRSTAIEASTVTTGHAAPIVDELGDGHPLPRHLIVGTGSMPELALEHGLWVPHLHYVNGLVDPPRAVMTGLTRHGLRRIVDGRLGPRVRDLRFGDSMIEALARVDGVGAIARIQRGALGLTRCPTLRIRDFVFTDTTG